MGEVAVGRAARDGVPGRGLHHPAPRQLRRRLAGATRAHRSPGPPRRTSTPTPRAFAASTCSSRRCGARGAQDALRLRRTVAPPRGRAGQGARRSGSRQRTSAWCSAATCCGSSNGANTPIASPIACAIRADPWAHSRVRRARAPHLQRAVGDAAGGRRRAGGCPAPPRARDARTASSAARPISLRPAPSASARRIARSKAASRQTGASAPFSRALLLGNVADRDRPRADVAVAMLRDELLEVAHVAGVVAPEQAARALRHPAPARPRAGLVSQEVTHEREDVLDGRSRSGGRRQVQPAMR